GQWASAPQLTPLSFWAEARARVLLKPKVSARVSLLVLLSLPMGIAAGDAIGIAAAALVVLSLGGYTLAAVVTEFAAGKWVTPTPLRAGPVALAIGRKVILIQAVTCTAVILLVSSIAPPHL